MDREEEVTIVPGNRRRVQKRRWRRKELFGKKRKEIFIEALSCSCNVTAAAEAAGIVVNTAYNHRRTDPAFREMWWQALEQGAAKLVALRLQREIERAENPSGALDVTMDGPPDERQIADLYKLIGLLKEHSRGLSADPSTGSGRGGNRKGAAPQVASVEETCAALAKRLKAFGLGGGAGATKGAA